MTLVNHMQIFLGNGNSPMLWLDAYHAPLIPIAPGFSWQCDLGRWRSLEPCFALCVKIVFHVSICNYEASTALMGTVFAFWLFSHVFLSFIMDMKSTLYEMLLHPQALSPASNGAQPKLTVWGLRHGWEGVYSRLTPAPVIGSGIYLLLFIWKKMLKHRPDSMWGTDYIANSFFLN